MIHGSKRLIEVEAVFGQLKSNNKFSRFTLRKMDKVNIEFGLMSIGHNLRKLAQKVLGNHRFLVFCGSKRLLGLPIYKNQRNLSKLNYLEICITPIQRAA